jgi:4-amino-4-deoxy-L-arabinose transferase-like glycosyltransferase
LSRRGIAPLAILLAGLAGVLFFRIGVPPAANPAEARVAGVVQEMVSSGDWLVPRLDGEPRLHKPPGYYWVAAAISSLTGEATWASVRAGSALAALGLVAATFFWGRAIGGPALGLGAALCLATMHYTAAFGRRGVAEMLLSLSTVLALASFDRVCFARERRWIPSFALALCLGILAKATAALLMIGVPIGVWLALDPASRSRARALLPGSALALCAGFLWYAVVFARVPGAAETIVAEAALPLGLHVAGPGSALHYRLPTDYVGPLVTGTLPAGLLLPLAIWHCAKTRLYAANPRLRFVALGFGSLLTALALLPQKQRHYLLPLLPLLALLLAGAALELRARAPELTRLGMLGTATLASLLGAAGLVALSCFYGDFLGVARPLRLALLAGGSLLLGGLLWAAYAGRTRAFVGLGTATALAFLLTWFGSIDIWRRQFENGTATSRPDYEAARWAQASAEHPRIARFLHAGAAGS